MASLPYTRTGDIVIAVNPYKWLHDLYSFPTRELYSSTLVWNTNSTSSTSTTTTTTSTKGGGAGASVAGVADPRTLLEPHVYEASSLAYRGLATHGEDQSILVSGESGAGKTETVKICMNHLASIQNNPGDAAAAVSGRKSTTIHGKKRDDDFSEIVQRVLDSNPLLEAFGNAKTVRNDNSSRFGKYIQLQFDTPPKYSTNPGSAPSSGSCQLAGSKCQVYLLEKSRVISHADGERSFHIFYQMLAAPDDLKIQIWKGLEDTDKESFNYVGWTDTDSIEGMSDANRFQLTMDSLRLIGVHGESLFTLLRAICIVLQLGNLEFEPMPDNEDRSEISSQEELEELAELMGILPLVLTTGLTIRTMEARGEAFKVPLTAEKAKDSTDAFAKEIYAKTFLWLVRTVNDATCAEKNYTSPTKRQQTSSFGIIGLLDIFGFETFKVNRFEQLCINYANEKLQQKFTQDIFRSVQTEYEFEGIELGEITYDDNTDVLDLVEGGMGLLALLNEECVRPKGADKTFVFKAQAMNKENPCFIRDQHWSDVEFGIRHYAGRVRYNATNFVTKNQDTLPTDLQDCATQSSNAILANELSNDTMMNPTSASGTGGGVGSYRADPPSSGAAASPSPTRKKKKRPKSKAGNPANSAAAAWALASTSPSLSTQYLKRGQSNIVAETVWTKFKNQLSSLMMQLGETRTRYIRCIKPNQLKQPLLMEHSSTVEQLRCAGVVAAVTISRSAFPNRLDHGAVLDRFRSLWPKGADHIIEHHINRQDSDESYEIENTTKIAVEKMLTLALKDLEFEKNGTRFRAFVIGKSRAYFRAGALEFLEGERLKYLGVWAIVMQRSVRRFVCRTKYVRLKCMVVCMQSIMRKRIAATKYRTLRKAIIRVQCWVRVLTAVRTIIILRRNARATQIQVRWRILVNRRRFNACVAATIVIQAMVRGCLQPPKYRQALIDKKDEAKLENQLRILQRKLEEAEEKRGEAEKKAEERAVSAVRELLEKAAAEKVKAEQAAAEKIAAEKAKAVRVAAEEAAVQKAKTEEEKKEREEGKKAIAAQEAAATAKEEEEKRQRETEEREELQRQLQRQQEEQHQLQEQLTAEQQTLMDESGKMLEYLRMEVFKLRGQNAQMKSDFDLLKDNNQRLMDANASAGASFGALNQHAKQLSKQNANIQADLAAYKEQVQKLNVLQIELKEELKMKSATYVAEVHSRLQYQRSLGRVTDIIQEQCRDHRLVEFVLEIADECDMEHISDMSENIAPQQQQQSHPETPKSDDLNNSRSSFFGWFASP
jgi:myosin-5